MVHFETATTRLTVSRVGVPRILGVYHKPLGRNVLAETVPLMEVAVDGEPVPEGWLTTTRAGAQEGGYVLAHDEGELTWRLRWETLRGSVGFSLSMALGEGEGREVRVRYPALPADMGGRDEPAYCFPSIAPAIGSEDRKLSASYSGWGIRHPFMAVQTADGSGCLMVEARDPAVESLALAKDGRSVTLGVEARPVTFSEGGVRTVPGFSIQCLAGDWHSALEEYRGGLREPVAPRPDWVRDIWNFRQRFLGWLDPMWPDRSQPVDLWPAVREAEEQFGGIDYLHIFDWGTIPGLGRIYHRPGDPDPSEHWPGGYPAFEAAMDELQEAGIPVGLYIEGYLLETRGPLGQRIGDEVAIIDEAGEPRFWPDATEVFACPWLPMWRDIQARTYARAARNLSPSGMYIDEFGFCSTWRDCYATDHGHGVPMNQIDAEQGFVEEVREHVDAVDPGIILYTEESPPDSNAHLQDASFTYAMNQCYHAEARVPLNLYRFVHPGFKTIEILICDKPTGTWASGVAWTFFNGEAIWLEGPPQEWFAPQTLEMIRKCHGILSAHADAFSSSRVTPLVPTVVTGIHANEFVGEDEVIYTLYNEGHTSYEGPVLVVPEGFSGTATDVWCGREAVVSRVGGHRMVHARVGPRSVGCVTIARE
ncbi:MAG: hypothetical protein GF320_16065 [Armatimonadia bacterium]|nr:hypothetical protein [Armatimonadia bacterium]